MKITRNGELYNPTNITRKGDTVSLTVGCEQVTLDLEAVNALATAKEQTRGLFYFVSRDPTTGKIHGVHGGDPTWDTPGGPDGPRVGQQVLGTDKQDVNTKKGWVWCIEYHMTKPKREEP